MGQSLALDVTSNLAGQNREIHEIRRLVKGPAFPVDTFLFLKRGSLYDVVYNILVLYILWMVFNKVQLEYKNGMTPVYD